MQEESFYIGKSTETLTNNAFGAKDKNEKLTFFGL
jgi:hypothetical protein